MVVGSLSKSWFLDMAATFRVLKAIAGPGLLASPIRQDVVQKLPLFARAPGFGVRSRQIAPNRAKASRKRSHLMRR